MTFATDGSALERVADLDGFAIAEHQHVVELDLAAGFDIEQLDAERSRPSSRGIAYRR
jgi:hypothetical protein